MSPHMALALVMMFGCQNEADYPRIQIDCETEIRVWAPERSAVDVVDSIGKRCASTLGDSVGIEWDSFGLEPADLGGSDTGAYLLASLLTIAASDAPTLAETLADPDLPDLARLRLQEIALVDGLADESPAAAAWFSLVHTAIRSTTYSQIVQGGAYAQYNIKEQRVTVADNFVGLDGTLVGADVPAAGAGVILHEAAHSFTDVHEPCSSLTPQSCDATINGAYGIGIWWLHAWRRTYGGELSPQDCSDLHALLFGQCNHIEAVEGWLPCEDDCP